MDTAQERQHSLIKFLGFSGIVAIIAAAIAVGKTAAVVDENTSQQRIMQTQVAETSAEIRVQQQELNEFGRRIEKLEDKR